MILRFAGVGSAFCGQDQWQTNAVLTDDNPPAPPGRPRDPKHLLIDCGSDARFSLKELGVELKDIERIYISHLHADHVGGLEWLAFSTFFAPHSQKPILHASNDLIHELWYSTLRGGLESIQGEVATLDTYFDVMPVRPNDDFRWRGVICQPVQTVHIVSGYKITHSYGLMIDFISVIDMKKEGVVRRIFFTGDTQFCPKQIEAFYAQADLIFQDCETAPYKSTVHAHYDDLKTLPPEVKKKMWLMHYQAYMKTGDEARKDGFAGFVVKGQEFVL